MADTEAKPSGASEAQKASGSPTPGARASDTATKYVGTPAVGTSKAAPAAGVAAVGPSNSEVDKRRRTLIWSAVVAFLTAWLIAFFRFFLPRTLFEPNTVFKVGYPADYGLGVDTKWQQAYRIWVDRTPDWKPAENKFKCPCHGSGYDSEGINFEGPAPRPMDRAHIELDPTGQIVVDTSRLYSWPKGQPSHFNDPGSYISV